MTVDAARGPPDGASDDPITVLIMDDEAIVRRLLRRCLEPAGWTVAEAENGLEGLAMLQAGTLPVDAVGTDLDMPLIDGYEVLEVLAGQRPEVPGGIISGSPGARARLAHARAILPKPFLASALLDTLAPVLEAALAMRARARQQRADAQEARTLAAY